MAEGDVSAYLVRAQRSLEAGKFEEAKEAIEKGYALEPDDGRVREFYQQILLADGVRLTRRARDMRRDEIRSLGKRERASYRDSERVMRAFEEALESMDKVLAINPDNAKALMLKAGILDRMDRKGRRQEVLQLFERALEIHPGNEELLYARERIVRPCAQCGDTGLCPDCKGSGEVSALAIKSSCPTCRGSGVCNRCGIF
jgi:tetratricopeptide (TPR) repeat protein